ncbi:MAG: class I SAM-dependent methyltransferase [Candidatus Poseidoniaceae archaeon]|jgi:SAM-dependent methyltransferase|nr:class I SAM-dependent methyltransferase [Candidatus Poseidoniaceae archaeon]
MDRIRKQLKKFSDAASDSENPLSWFETLYEHANGDNEWIPWSKGDVNPFLKEWINSEHQVGNALVVGCGLGEDAAYLTNMGWRVTAFDLSPSAIEWAKKIYSELNIDWQVADLTSPPEKWFNKFDLVVEVHILQAIPENIRINAAPNLAKFVSQDGHLICIGRIDEFGEDVDGPPWPLDRLFIQSIGQNLKEIQYYCKRLDGDEENILRYCSVWKNL